MAKKKFMHLTNHKKYADITDYCPCCEQVTTHTVYVTKENGERVPLRDMVPPEKYGAVLAYLRAHGDI